MDLFTPNAGRTSRFDSDRILVGTASWTDPTLVQCGRFYPKGCTSAEARLAFYASVFPLVEVNSSYYGLPSQRNSELWVKRSPERFKFNIKAFRLFTGHQTPLEAFPGPMRAVLAGRVRKNVYYKDVPESMQDDLWRYFREGIEPLRAAGKLGAVHFQFAPWCRYSDAVRAHLEQCRTRLSEVLVSVEFRHQSWFTEAHTESTLSFLRQAGLVNTVVDEPQGFENTVRAVWATTHPRLSIVRLHGRNADTWNLSGSESSTGRFNYNYSDQELEGLAAQVRALAAASDQTHVVFNNNYEDQGQRNARSFAEILQRGGRALD
ncbi:MAG: DUF72 domain-containing protein [Burkholderiaceae bacterium]|jgi:uncharacterized protein YecE (DUF72 family)